MFRIAPATARGDVDGDAVADFAVTMTGLKNLTAADFYL